jgi:hypothetical protein
MEREALDRVEELLAEQVKERIPGDAIKRVAVLQYGDDPMVEPGELVVRVYVATSGDEDERGRVLEEFMRANEETIKELHKELAVRLPEARRLEFLSEGERNARFMLARPFASATARSLAGGELTPVMARLGVTDLETLDTLITAGIASNRADAVRWAIGRIRERPAYDRLRERARELEELKTEF